MLAALSAVTAAAAHTDPPADVVVALNGAPLSGSASSAFRAFAVGTSVTFGLASAGVNFLEHASGLDIDSDGESGATPIGRLALRQTSFDKRRR